MTSCKSWFNSPRRREDCSFGFLFVIFCILKWAEPEYEIIDLPKLEKQKPRRRKWPQLGILWDYRKSKSIVFLKSQSISIFSQFFPGSTSKGPSSQGTQRKTLVQFLHKIKNGGVFFLSNTFLVDQDLISLEISTQKMIFSENFHKNLTPNI